MGVSFGVMIDEYLGATLIDWGYCKERGMTMALNEKKKEEGL